MKTFSARLIDEILLAHEVSQIHKLKIIVPSQRAKWQISKSLSTLIQKPFIFPHIDTIHNYILSHSKLDLIENYEAQLILCKTATAIDQSISQDIFYSQCPSILKEFNNIESYMINHKKLFYELSNITAIENWSLKDENLSKNQQNYISQYKKLGDLFGLFKSQLIKSKKGISGMLYREVAENHIEYFKNESNIYFIGLNALSKSEETIISYLSKEKKAKIFVDVDQYYVNNKDHEAGYFFRKHQHLNYNIPVQQIESSTKDITIHEVSTSIKQIEIISQIINKNSNKKFTIVTMDESLGPIIFESLIKNYQHINFSSGVSINFFEATKLFKFLSQDFLEGTNSTKEIDYLAFCKILNFNILKKNISNLMEVERKFNQSHSFKIQLTDIIWESNEFKILINQAVNWKKNNTRNFFFGLKEILSSLNEIYKGNLTEIKVLKIILIELEKIINKTTLHKFSLNNQQISSTLNSQISSFKVPIKGSKEAAIQVLGLLESRAIDVENIIYVSCNEDFLPKKETSNSLLPNDLRSYYGLPSKYEKEALFAYYFYRSLHFAKNIHLIKVKENNVGIQFSEPSRYLKQVEIELKKLSNINISSKTYSKKNENKTNYISTSETTQKSILQWMKKGVSPSSIITLTNCSLSFYYRYILKIREENIPEKFLQPSEWGTGIHQTLENLYAQYEIINTENMKKINRDLDKLMDYEFGIIFKDQRHLKGKNAIIYYHYKKCIAHFLKNEISTINQEGSFKILDLEKEYTVENEIEINKEKQTLKLKGVIDRIDSTSNGIRLIDYKSGLVQPQELVINSIDQIEKKSKALQLLFYSLLFVKNHNSSDPLMGQIISIKNTHQNTLNLRVNKQDYISLDHISKFENWLKELIIEINDPSMVFKHNSESKYCEWC